MHLIVTGRTPLGERGTLHSAPFATVYGIFEPAPWLWPCESDELDDAGVVEALELESEVDELELPVDVEDESPDVDGVVELVVPRLSFL